MKLHWSPRSPFVRKVMVAAHELSLVDRIECIRTVVISTSLNIELMRDNPLSKIPTMVLDSGQRLYDSSAICEYFDWLDGNNRLFPKDQDQRWDIQRRHACGNGLLDMLLLYRHERNRPVEQQSPELLAAFAAKRKATLALLESEVSILDTTPVNIGHIVVGCALSYLDFRFSDDPWRPECPQLSGWHATFVARPSMQATEIVDDS